ncbi:hypothetical protein SRABI128_06367 [Microbacterium sp. Bi128]|nr:hypothetical protein SRABI128_06367 [Microbacterium sp. Bi128]
MDSCINAYNGFAARDTRPRTCSRKVSERRSPSGVATKASSSRWCSASTRVFPPRNEPTIWNRSTVSRPPSGSTSSVSRRCRAIRVTAARSSGYQSKYSAFRAATRWNVARYTRSAEPPSGASPPVTRTSRSPSGAKER